MKEQQLPSDWGLAELGDFCSLLNGFAFKSKEYQPDGDFVIRIGNVQDGQIVLSNPAYIDAKAAGAERFRLESGDLLMSLTGNVGRVGVINENHLPAVLNQRVAKLEPLLEELVSNRWLFYLLRSPLYQSRLLKTAKGAAQLNISGKDVLGHKVPFCALAEQKQIAAKLDELLAQVDTIKTRLDTIPAILKRFRQSVLAAAVSGRLTEEWRGVESFGKKVCIGEIAIDIRYGTSKKCAYEIGATPVLRIPNIGDGYLKLDDLKFTDFEAKEREKLALKEGDILLIRSNGSVDLVGKVAVVTPNDTHCLFAGYLIRLRIDAELAQPRYVLYCLQSPQIRKVIEIQARSTSGVNNINSKELAALTLFLPSIEEQTQIVRRVEQLFTFADQIEQRVKDAQSRVNHLTQSILAKAFRGELTAEWREQNPDLISGANSAHALLERINVEREEAELTKKSRPRSVKKKPGKKMKKIISIVDALKTSDKPLTSQELLAAAGYQADSSTADIERFFLDVRERMSEGVITKERIGSEDVFALAE